MLNPDEERRILDLESKVAELTQSLDKALGELRDHEHRGTDGSKRIADFSCDSLVLVGGQPADIVSGAQFVSMPFTVVDNTIQQMTTHRRGSSFGIALTGKDTSAEQINTGILAGKTIVAPVTSYDFSKINFAQVRLIQLPEDTSTPPLAFFNASRTPLFTSADATGSITLGGSTLTDAGLSLGTDDLVGCIIVLQSAGTTLEAYSIASNTATEITINGTWASATGDYSYYVFAPVHLGSADTPWRRLYLVGDQLGAEGVNIRRAIRLGLGASGGSQVIWIAYGTGTPEGNVTANIGSLYLRTDGGAGTTLYVKESGTSNTGWVGK